MPELPDAEPHDDAACHDDSAGHDGAAGNHAASSCDDDAAGYHAASSGDDDAAGYHEAASGHDDAAGNHAATSNDDACSHPRPLGKLHLGDAGLRRRGLRLLGPGGRRRRQPLGPHLRLVPAVRALRELRERGGLVPGRARFQPCA